MTTKEYERMEALMDTYGGSVSVTDMMRHDPEEIRAMCSALADDAYPDDRAELMELADLLILYHDQDNG